MTSDVISVQVSEQLEECMATMIEKNIRHLPVYEDGQLLGLISVRDVLREVVEVQKSLISLEHSWLPASTWILLQCLSRL